MNGDASLGHLRRNDSIPGKQYSLNSLDPSFCKDSSSEVPIHLRNIGTILDKCLPKRYPTVRDIVPIA